MSSLASVDVALVRCRRWARRHSRHSFLQQLPRTLSNSCSCLPIRQRLQRRIYFAESISAMSLPSSHHRPIQSCKHGAHTAERHGTCTILPPNSANTVRTRCQCTNAASFCPTQWSPCMKMRIIAHHLALRTVCTHYANARKATSLCQIKWNNYCGHENAQNCSSIWRCNHVRTLCTCAK